MNKLVSIVVTVNDGFKDHTFKVDTEQQCALFWSKDGWDALAEFYRDVQKNPEKEREVRDRKCPKAKPQEGTDEAKPGGEPVIAIKAPCGIPTQWP